MSRKAKEAIVQEVIGYFSEGQGIVFSDFRGLNVKQMTDLRAKLRENGADMKVVKNTLVALAAEERGIDGLDDILVGPTAIAYSTEDPTVTAKTIGDFAKEHPALEVKGGVLKGQVIDAAEVKALGNLPSREVLLAQVLRGMQSPVAGLVGALSGCIRNLAYVLAAIQEQKGDAA